MRPKGIHVPRPAGGTRHHAFGETRGPVTRKGDEVDSFFKISARNSTVGNEVIGGLTTFLAMAYIIVVNSSMMADACWRCSMTAAISGA